MEAQIRAGHPDLPGLFLALADWSAELFLIRKECTGKPRGGQVTQE